MYRMDPVQVGSATDWVTLRPLTNNTCAVRGTERELLCWGSGIFGVVGDGTTEDRLVPTEIAVAQNSGWMGIGGSQFTCVLKQDGKIYCWGSQSFGNLGDGVVASKNLPARVGDVTNWLKVSVGGHSCGIRRDGALFCWGTNEAGALGIGTFASAFSPQRVGTFTGWSDITQDFFGFTSCGIRANQIYCWGANDFG